MSPVVVGVLSALWSSPVVISADEADAIMRAVLARMEPDPAPAQAPDNAEVILARVAREVM